MFIHKNGDIEFTDAISNSTFFKTEADVIYIKAMSVHDWTEGIECNKDTTRFWWSENPDEQLTWDEISDQIAEAYSQGRTTYEEQIITIQKQREKNQPAQTAQAVYKDDTVRCSVCGVEIWEDIECDCGIDGADHEGLSEAYEKKQASPNRC
jgi:hypothetical protein